ncbi:MAG: ankyrin repeat domain-containing protein [Armatimonadetes bacterium]|nr:ankyrin repeat domain-containing protein [Armatimonadota bacterium]
MGRLHRLVDAARHDDVKTLLATGVDVNEVADNLTPLDLAIHNDDVAMVDLLIRAGADVNHGHPNTGKRPLHDASTKNDLRILNLLLAAGADVEGCREISTPLCMAARMGKREAYDRLIEAGANPEATQKGKTAREIMESAVDHDERVRQQFEIMAQNRKPDQHANKVREMMAEYPIVEEFAAHRGRHIYIFGFRGEDFTDPTIAEWVRRLGEILHSSELSDVEEKYLTGDELEEARRLRKQAERRLARMKARQARVEQAALEKS